MRLITVDLRLINASGMGSYLKNLMPFVMKRFLGQARFCFLGNLEELSQFDWTRDRNIQIIHHNSPIYSIAEQFSTLKKIPSDTTLFWSPHYNIPVFYRGKLLVTVYDLFHLSEPNLVGGIHKRIYAKLMFKAVKAKADAILAISEFTKKEFMRLAGNPIAKIHAITLGIDADWFASKEGQINRPRPFLLYVGNVKPHKNLKTLVAAFDKIKNVISHDLVIVGKKEGFITGDKNIESYVRALGDRIHFTGFIDDKTLRQYYQNADLFIFPSLYEGFGFPPLEAMASGCPVIASNSASIPEVCGDAALYFEALDPNLLTKQILKLVDDPNLKSELRLKGLQRVENFRWDECAKKTCEVIKNVLDQ